MQLASLFLESIKCETAISWFACVFETLYEQCCPMSSSSDVRLLLLKHKLLQYHISYLKRITGNFSSQQLNDLLKMSLLNSALNSCRGFAAEVGLSKSARHFAAQGLIVL